MGALVPCALCTAWAISAAGHPTPAETAEHQRERAICVQEVAEAERLDPVKLGQRADALRAAFGDALTPAPGNADPPRRLSRQVAHADVVAVDYDLHDGRVFRVRWRLARRFEVPALDALVVQGRACLGEPAYDQTLEPKPGRPQPVVRRIGWSHGERRIELRQLHPLTGGPVSLSVADRAALDAALKDEAQPLPEPTSEAPWWERAHVPHIPDDAERRVLADAFGALLAQLDH